MVERGDGRYCLPDNYYNLRKNNTASPHFVGMLRQSVERGIAMQPSMSDFVELAIKSPKKVYERVACEMLVGIDTMTLFEDEHLLVINKPNKIPSHYGDASPVGVQEVARHLKGMNVQLAHRLDADTSGALILTKSFDALVGMAQQFADKEQSSMKKVYLALLDGEFDTSSSREVRVDIYEREDRKMQVVPPDRPLVFDPTVRSTITHFEPQVLYETQTTPPAPKTLTAVQLITGKKHQIRAVAAQVLKMPLTGDYFYNHDRDGASRLMLHAFELDFQHPVTGEEMNIVAPLPADFTATLASLKRVRSYK